MGNLGKGGREGGPCGWGVQGSRGGVGGLISRGGGKPVSRTPENASFPYLAEAFWKLVCPCEGEGREGGSGGISKITEFDTKSGVPHNPNNK